MPGSQSMTQLREPINYIQFTQKDEVMEDFNTFKKALLHLSSANTISENNEIALDFIDNELFENGLDTPISVPTWFYLCVARLIDNDWTGMSQQEMHEPNKGDVFNFLATYCIHFKLPMNDDGEIKSITFPSIMKKLTFYFEGDRYQITKV